MKQPEDRVTLDWLGDVGQQNRQGGGMLEQQHPGRGRKPGQRCGAYQGAVKLGSDNMRARAKTGKTQAEFAALCGISERTLRTWEATGEVSIATGRCIARALVGLMMDARQRRAVKYRDSYTGATWAGRGVMPAWLKAELAKGRRLSEFSTGA